MSRRLNSWIVAVVRPPLLAVGFVFGRLYKLLFAESDRKSAKKNEEQLAGDVQDFVPFLFRDMGGQVVPNEGVEFPPPFDYAIVTVETPDVRMKFTRGRDHLAAQIAPKSVPNNFHELSTVLIALEIPGVQRGSASSLMEANQLLRLHVKELVEAFTEDHYPALQAKLQEIYDRDRVIRKQHEIELNRRLYG